MGDKIKPGSAAWHNRQRRWTMYGFIGSCAWMEGKIFVILKSGNFSQVTKQKAEVILKELDELKTSIEKDIKNGL